MMPLEDGKRIVQPRMKMLGASHTNLTMLWDNMGNAKANLELLKAEFRADPYQVLYIDTLKFFLGAARLRQGNAYDQSVEDMRPLVEFVLNEGVALTLSTHLKKDKYGIEDWQDLFTGSVGFLATAHHIQLLQRRRNEKTALLRRSSRTMTDDDDIGLMWSDRTGWGPSQVDGVALRRVMSARAGSCHRTVAQHLMRRGPTTKSALVDACKPSDSSVAYRAIRELISDGTCWETGDLVGLQGQPGFN